MFGLSENGNRQSRYPGELIPGKQPYKNIQHTMEQLRDQIVRSYEYANEICPRFDNPKDLFKWLRFNTRYQKDPVGVELLQQIETMMENNGYGVAGAGDCDCFTIATLACMAVNGWDGKYIALVGNRPDVPSHIYSVIDWNGLKALDLTNPYYNMERLYQYKQLIPV